VPPAGAARVSQGELHPHGPDQQILVMVIEGDGKSPGQRVDLVSEGGLAHYPPAWASVHSVRSPARAQFGYGCCYR
jgi:hypothetical protein